MHQLHALLVPELQQGGKQPVWCLWQPASAKAAFRSEDAIAGPAQTPSLLRGRRRQPGSRPGSYRHLRYACPQFPAPRPSASARTRQAPGGPARRSHTRSCQLAPAPPPCCSPPLAVRTAMQQQVCCAVQGRGGTWRKARRPWLSKSCHLNPSEQTPRKRPLNSNSRRKWQTTAFGMKYLRIRSSIPDTVSSATDFACCTVQQTGRPVGWAGCMLQSQISPSQQSHPMFSAWWFLLKATPAIRAQ